MSLNYHRTIKLISKEPRRRTTAEIEHLLPWLRKHNQILASTDKDVLIALVRNCTFREYQQDEVVIRQGEVGDTFYIMLSGRASIYIDPSITGEDQEGQQEQQKKQEEKKEQAEGTKEQPQEPEEMDELDRTKYGKHLGSYVAGDSFGELALINKEAFRNASIITDDVTDLMQIDRNTYEATLKAKQEQDLQEQSEFVNTCPLFTHWSHKIKRLLEMSVRKIVLPFGAHIVRQGDPVEGLFFIVKGEAKIVVDAKSHENQFQKLFDPSNNALAKELGRNFVKKEEKKRETLQQEQVRVRRRQGYVAAEKRLAQKAATLCFVDENEVVGAGELALGLEIYTQSVVCTATTEVFLLDNRNIERFIQKKYTTAIDTLRESVLKKLVFRRKSKIGTDVKLFDHMIDALVELQPKRTTKEISSATKSSIKETDAKKQADLEQLVDLYLQDKSPLIDPFVPGTVYYKTQAVQRGRKRMMDRLRKYSELNKPISGQLRLERARKASRRQPRSRRELERLTVAQDPQEASKLNDRNHAVNRFLSQGSTINVPTKPRPQTASSRLTSAQPIFRLTEPQVNGDFSVHDVDYSDIKEEEVKHILRDMGDLQENKNASRARVICSMMDKNSNQQGMSLIGGIRPKSAPITRISTRSNQWQEEEEDPGEAFDLETSDTVLTSLECKLRAFHQRHEPESKRGGPRIEQLRRFIISKPDDVPIPGGTVFVRQRECKFPPGSNLSTTQHQHIRRFIIPKDAVAVATKALSTRALPDPGNTSVNESERNFRPISAPSLKSGHSRPRTGTRKQPTRACSVLA